MYELLKSLNQNCGFTKSTDIYSFTEKYYSATEVNIVLNDYNIHVLATLYNKFP